MPQVRNKVTAFLDSLEHAFMSSSSNAKDLSRMQLDSTVNAPLGKAEDCLSTSALSTAICGQAILQELSCVNILEQKYDRLSRATNHAYWKLGNAYRMFCEVSHCSTLLTHTDVLSSSSASQH